MLMAQLTLTKWNRIKAEMIEMWQLVVSNNLTSNLSA